MLQWVALDQDYTRIKPKLLIPLEKQERNKQRGNSHNVFLIKHFHSMNCQLFITTALYLHGHRFTSWSLSNNVKRTQRWEAKNTYHRNISVWSLHVYPFLVQQDNPPAEQALCFTSPFQTVYVNVKCWHWNLKFHYMFYITKGKGYGVRFSLNVLHHSILF